MMAPVIETPARDAPLAVPADRELRVPVRLRVQLPDLARGRRRVDVRPAARLAEHLRVDPRPRRRLVPRRPARHPGPVGTPVPARHPRAGDDVADADRLARSCATRWSWARGTTRRSAPRRTAARPPTTTPSTSCCAPSRASAAPSTWRSSATRRTTTAADGTRWEYDGTGYNAIHADSDERPDPAPHQQPAPGHRRADGVGPHAHGQRRQGVHRAVLVAAARADHVGGRRRPAVADAGVLARVDHAGRLPRPPVAHVPAAQRAHAQGPDLRPDRRPARRGHHLACPRRPAASATGTTATPGSATPRSPCGASTRSAWTARPTTSSRSSTTSAATTRTCRSCTASAARRSSRSSSWATCPATRARSRCGSATPPTTSSSTTSGAPCSTPSTCTPARASSCPSRCGPC